MIRCHSIYVLVAFIPSLLSGAARKGNFAPFVKKFIGGWKENKTALNQILELELFDTGDIRSALEYKSLPPDIYEFMLAHENHELVIRSEYHPSVEDEAVIVKPE